jgi:hypothetical protein
MADKSSSLVVEALQRAVSHPAGLPLYASKSVAGLFAGTAPAKKAAQVCKDQGLVHTLRSETRGKTTHEICAVTEKGLAFLLTQLSPREAVQALVSAVDARQGEMTELLAGVRQTQASLEALKALAETVLRQIRERDNAPMPLPCDKTTSNGHSADAWLPTVLDHLSRWQASATLEDCPLPALYQIARHTAPTLTIGQFHDGLRRLHEQERVYLHPWTGPLYEIPEPTLALLVGHEIAYYASLR